METLDLNAYGVEEMSKQEMLTTDGGSILGTILVIVACVVVTYILDALGVPVNTGVTIDNGGEPVTLPVSDIVKALKSGNQQPVPYIDDSY